MALSHEAGTTQDDVLLRRALIVSPIVMAAGTFAPWFAINLIVMSYSENAFATGPGVVILLCAALAGGSAYLTLNTSTPSPTLFLVIIAACGVGALITLKTMFDMQQGIALGDVVEDMDVTVPMGVFIQAGWGLWLTLVASVAGALSAWMMYRRQGVDTHP